MQIADYQIDFLIWTTKSLADYVTDPDSQIGWYGILPADRRDQFCLLSDIWAD